MSQQNVEVVRSIVGAARTGQAAIAALLDPDVRLDVSRLADGDVYHGPAAYFEFFRRWFGTWDELEVVPEQFIDRGDRVLVLLTMKGRGKGSGVPVVLRAADLWTVRDGKVVELVGYPDREEALAAVGLSE